MTGSEADGETSSNGSGEEPGSLDEAPPKRKRTSVTGALFHDAARALGKTAGRARNALERIGERGAVSLAVRKFQREKNQRLKELGTLAREALAKPDGQLRAGDPRVGELLHSLDRLDEKIERLTEEAEDEATGPSEDAAGERGKE